MAISAHSKLHQRYRHHLARCARVGLFIGSFDPPHEGHFLLAENARRALNLGAVWWCISPGNPQKQTPRNSLKDRFIKCTACTAKRSRFHIPVLLETDLGTSTTADFLDQLFALDKRRFVILLGSDTFTDLHTWHRWKAIVRSADIYVYPRTESVLKVMYTHAAQYFRSRRRSTIMMRRPGNVGRKTSFWGLGDCLGVSQRSRFSSTRIREDTDREDLLL